jgi:fatty-acyl-CoA synthase
VDLPTNFAGHWIESRARSDGSRRALVDADRDLDYASLHDRITRCASMLHSAGIRRGDRIGVLLGNRSAYIETVFAAARLAAIAVPLNTRFTAAEIRRILDDCTPHALIYEHDLSQLVEIACNGTQQPPSLRISCGGPEASYETALAAQPPESELQPVGPDDPMLLVYTSGTTGEPKGALLPHRKTLYNNLNAVRYFELSERDRTLVPLPLFHSFGLLILALPTLYAGGAVHLMPRFDAKQVWEIIEREQISILGGVPTLFQALHDALLEPEQARLERASLRVLFSAGAPLPTELIQAYDAQSLSLQQGYGQTETSILCCLEKQEALRKAGSVGRPVFHAELRVIDTDCFASPPEQWRDVPVGESGEIVVRGPTTFLGYWNRPKASAQTLRGDWLRTGDLARMDDEGFITLVARVHEMYISGGENVYPAEVEGVLAEHPAVREVAVIGIPDRKWGEVGRAYLVASPNTQIDSEALLAWAAERLARFKLPREIVIVPSLPRTASGKVQKHRIPTDLEPS